MPSLRRSPLTNALTFCSVVALSTTSCGPAPSPAPLPPNDATLARARRPSTGEPPAFVKVGELYCYDDKKADQFIRWRADSDAACEDKLADKQEDLDIAKVREGSSDTGVSVMTVVIIAVSALLAGFGGGLGAGLANK